MCYKDIVCKQKPSDKGCTYRNKIIYDLKSYHYEDIGQSEGIQSEKETDEEELEDAMKQFTTPETLMQPMLMEVFTDKEKDTTLLREYYHGLKNKPNE